MFVFQEELFDVSDLQDTEANLISKCGSLELTFTYSSKDEKMSITVHQAKDIPTKERGGASNCQVSVLNFYITNHCILKF